MNPMKKLRLLFVFIAFLSAAALGKHDDSVRYWMKIKARDKFARSVVANTGVSIETTRDEYVYAVGSYKELKDLQTRGWVEVYFPVDRFNSKDFPTEDKDYTNYDELTKRLQDLHRRFPDITALSSIGKSI